MAFAQECRDNTEQQQCQKPWHKHNDTSREGNRSDDLLEQPAELLNQQKPIGGLHPRALELVMEAGVFVSCKVERRSLLHESDANVLNVAISEKSVGEVRGPAKEHGGRGNDKLQSDPPPESWTQGTAVGNKRYDSIEDDSANAEKCQGAQSSQDSEKEAPRDNTRSRLPDERDNGGNVSQCL